MQSTSNESTPEAARKALSRPSRLALSILAIVAAVGYVATSLWFSGEIGFPLDDSWIHLQFARNLAAGDGLSYRPGELVTGSTSPLWTAVVSLLFYLPGRVELWILLLGLVFHVASIHATWRLGRVLGLSKGAALFAGLATLLTNWVVWAAVSGLEIPLFTMLSLYGMRLHIEERGRSDAVPRSLFVLGLAALARPEGLLLLLAALADRMLEARAPLGSSAHRAWPRTASWVAGLGAAALLIGPVMLFNMAVGDSVLPTTFGAKTSGTGLGLPSLRYLYTVFGIFFRPQPVLSLMAGAGVVSLVVRLGSKKDRGLLPAFWLLGLPLAYGVLGSSGQAALVGNFGRYYFPLFPVLILLGTLGLESAFETGKRAGPGRFLRLAALVVLLPTLWTLVQGATRYAQNVANVQTGDVGMARWLAPRLPSEAVIAVNDVGALQYFLPNRVLDIAGIMDPRVTRYVKDARREGRGTVAGVRRFLDEERPDYLVIFPNWYPGLATRELGFEAIAGRKIPNNITLGGDEVIVFATPWTTFPLREENAEETE